MKLRSGRVVPLIEDSLIKDINNLMADYYDKVPFKLDKNLENFCSKLLDIILSNRFYIHELKEETLLFREKMSNIVNKLINQLQEERFTKQCSYKYYRNTRKRIFHDLTYILLIIENQ